MMCCRVMGILFGLLVGAVFLLQPVAGEEPETPPDLAPLVNLLGEVDDPGFQNDLLKGMLEGLKGRRSMPMPKGWATIYKKLEKSPNPEVRQRARLLALVFDDPQVLKRLQSTMMNVKASPQERRQALTALVQKRVQTLPESLLQLLTDSELCSDALRGLAAFDHPKTAETILQRYSQFTPQQKQDAITTLAARSTTARRLVSAMEQNLIPPREVSAFTARKLMSFGDAELNTKLIQTWGDLRQTSQEKQQVITKYQTLLTPDFLKKADLVQGRLVYKRTCSKCHVLFDDGGKIGPALTGSNRRNLDYVLENVLDPSALIGRDYKLVSIVTEGGRQLDGIITEETVRSLTVQTANEKVVLSKEDIVLRKVQPISMMPEGQFEKLSNEEVRNLIAYLASPVQVPLPEDAEENTR